MDTLEFFLRQHAQIHSTEVAAAEGGFSLLEALLRGLTDDQFRVRPRDGMNSLAWLLWHITRGEDIAVNTIVAHRPQVLDDGWLRRLNLSSSQMGTGMTDDEVSDFSTRVDIPALRAYRVAVGQRTREVVPRLLPGQLDEVVEASHLGAVPNGAIGERGRWLEKFWQGKTKGWFLSWLVLGHGAMHLGEAVCVRTQLGARWA